MATWFERLIQPDSPAPYRIEFICFVVEPEVIETVEGVFKDLHAAIAEGKRIGGAERKNGWQLAEYEDAATAGDERPSRWACLLATKVAAVSAAVRPSHV
jgi:hypothetical protein